MCDATASPSDESSSESRDSDLDPKYSLSDDSYSDRSNINSYSLHEVEDSTLNETKMQVWSQREKTGNRIAEKGRKTFNQNGK